MLKRIRLLWALSKKDPKKVDEIFDRKLVDSIPEQGDGKAEFIPEATAEDYAEFQKEESGTKSWYDRIRRL